MSASNRRYNHGLVRGWDWRTTPARLDAMLTCAKAMKISKTTLLEFAVDYLLKSKTNTVFIDGGIGLVTWGPAEQTQRRLGDSLEKECYVEWGALAHNAFGEAYKMLWLHKDDGRDPEEYDWQDVYEVQRDYDNDISV